MGFGTLAIIFAVSLVGPLLAIPRWMRLPVVVGELIVGMALGATGLGVLHAQDPTFALLADIGFALVMLVAGTHIPVRDPLLRQGIRVGGLRALATIAVAAVLGMGAGWLFHTGHGPLYSVIIASSSAALALPILHTALGSSATPGVEYVRMVAQIAVADTLCIVLLPLVIDPPRAVHAAVGALAVMAAGAVAFAFMWWAQRSGWRRRVHEVSENGEYVIELRIVLTVLFATVALALSLHVSVMLAGFVTGVAIAGAGEPRRVAKQIFALTEGFFAPIYFVWLGASLNLRDLLTHPAAIGLGLTLGLGGIAAHVLAGTVTKQPWADGVMSAGQLGVPMAAATLGTTHALLHPGEATAFLLGSLVTIAGCSIASRFVGRGDERAT